MADKYDDPKELEKMYKAISEAGEAAAKLLHAIEGAQLPAQNPTSKTPLNKNIQQK